MQNICSRTHEGSGIGIALVQELAKLHGGFVRAESRLGIGSTFFVTIPLGTGHLPQDKIVTSVRTTSAAVGVTPFVEETLRWLPEESGASSVASGAIGETNDTILAGHHASLTTHHARVLIADDNADMRQYVSRLLAERYTVEAVADGEAALVAARAQRPDLILSDVMMPKLDGFGLIQELRNNPGLKTVPVILLSALAGEESRVEGLEQGVDDYLIKPFSARELLARVGAHLELARLRREQDARTAADLHAMTLLYEVGNRCMRAENHVRHCLDDIVEAAIMLTGADKGNLQVLDRATETMTIAAQRGFGEPFLTFFAAVRCHEASACGAAMRAGKRVIVEDVTQSDIFVGMPSLDVLLEAGVRAVQSTPLLSGAGNVLGMISTHFSRPHKPSERELRLIDLLARQAADYLERKQAETALCDSETRYRNLVTMMPAAMYTIDRAGRITFYNDRAAELWGRRPRLGDEEMKFCGSHKLFLPNGEVLTHVKTPMVDALQDGASVHGQEVVIERLDGSRRHVIVHIDPLRDAEGTIVGAVNLFTDITERKKAEEALCAAVEFDEAVMSNMGEGLYTVDDQGCVTSLNPAAERLFGWTLEDLRGKKMHAITHHHYRDGRPFPVEECAGFSVLKSGVTLENYEDVFIRKDGTFFDVSYSSSPIVEHGRIKGLIVVFRDITARKEAEEALRHAQERLQRGNIELEQAVNAKTVELLRSQERLRALASELNLAEQRERKRLATELHDHLQQMLVLGKLELGQGKRFANGVPRCQTVLEKVDGILSDALTYSRTLVTELSPSVLHDHGLAAALKWLAEYMKQKHQQSVTVVVPEGDGLKLPEDQRILLFQSVRELLINSSKHASTGKATVRIEQVDDRVQIEVRDDGVGFDLAAAAAATPSGGISSKFGLFSIQERMKALGGSFGVRSMPGEGTTATLTLPLVQIEKDSGVRSVASDAQKGAGPSSHHAPRTMHHVSSVRVLLVDDHAMVRQGLRSVLDAYEDIQVIGEACDGAEAVRLVEELQPLVVVMDINMPKMNGIEATTRIKAHWPDITVVGISVNAGDENSDSMKRAGAAAVLPKDTAVEQLARCDRSGRQGVASMNASASTLFCFQEKIVQQVQFRSVPEGAITFVPVSCRLLKKSASGFLARHSCLTISAALIILRVADLAAALPL